MFVFLLAQFEPFFDLQHACQALRQQEVGIRQLGGLQPAAHYDQHFLQPAPEQAHGLDLFVDALDMLLQDGEHGLGGLFEGIQAVQHGDFAVGGRKRGGTPILVIGGSGREPLEMVFGGGSIHAAVHEALELVNVVAGIQADAQGGLLQGALFEPGRRDARPPPVTPEAGIDCLEGERFVLSPRGGPVVCSLGLRAGEGDENIALIVWDGLGRFTLFKPAAGTQPGMDGVDGFEGDLEARRSGAPTHPGAAVLQFDLPETQGEQVTDGHAGVEAQEEKGVITAAKGGGVAAKNLQQGVDFGRAEEAGAGKVDDFGARNTGSGVKGGRAGGVGAAPGGPAIKSGDGSQGNVDGGIGVTLGFHPVEMGLDVRRGQFPGGKLLLAQETAPDSQRQEGAGGPVKDLALGDPGFEGFGPVAETRGDWLRLGGLGV